MKWFVKAVCHYADFSGRARRTEYWMFVLLNVIFSVAWLVAFATAAGFVVDLKDAAMITVPYAYLMLMMLPTMAVTARRLHDCGNSGWWMLAGLIPIIGPLGMIIMACQKGDSGDNRYGADPKTAPEIFTDRMKLRSAATALIVAGVARIVANMMVAGLLYAKYDVPVFSMSIIFRLIDILPLFAGIFLMNETNISGMREWGRNAMLMLLITYGIGILATVYNFIQTGLDMPVTTMALINIPSTLYSASIIFFTAALLFVPKNKDAVRTSTITLIIMASINLLWQVMQLATNDVSFDTVDVVFVVASMLSMPILAAPILLAGTFLSSEELKY